MIIFYRRFTSRVNGSSTNGPESLSIKPQHTSSEKEVPQIQRQPHRHHRIPLHHLHPIPFRLELQYNRKKSMHLNLIIDFIATLQQITLLKEADAWIIGLVSM